MHKTFQLHLGIFSRFRHSSLENEFFHEEKRHQRKRQDDNSLSDQAIYMIPIKQFKQAYVEQVIDQINCEKANNQAVGFVFKYQGSGGLKIEQNTANSG
jgi:hypothetical protein